MELTKIGSRKDRPEEVDPGSLTTVELVSTLVSHHHAPLRGALPGLTPLSAKVAAVHGDHDPRLREIAQEFEELREGLEAHFDEAEETLFREVVGENPDVEEVRRDAAGLRHDHELAAASLRRIRELSDGYTPPPWACSSYRRLLAELQRLEEDVLRHARLETDVLLPRFLSA